jgi:cytoskeletal protein RodZ
MGVFGDTLRQARAHKGVTLREAEAATRINRHWLLALEEEHFDQLPAPIYQRGIVRNYANYLNLDQAKLLQLFSDARGDQPIDEPAILAQPTTLATAGSFVPNFAVIAFIVVAMGAVFAWGYSAYFAGPTDPLNGGSAIPTATALGDEDRFIATSTAAPPTSTPEATAEASAASGNDDSSSDEGGESRGRVTISYPTVTTTADTLPVDGLDESADGGTADDGELIEAPDVADGEGRSYSFYATSDVDLLIVVDNVIVWQQPLVEGQATGYLTGSSFVVSIDGADSIAVIDGDGVETVVSGPEFTLP